MPATAGRVRMPANNRVHSSAALQTHGIWQSAIGYDPYAPTDKGSDKGSARPGEDSVAADSENAYASFQGLLALARATGSGSNDARGSCKKCGRVGHLTFQCRNFLSTKDPSAADKEKDDAALQAAATVAFEQIRKSNGLKDESSEEEEEEEEESDSSDSDVDPEIEKIIAARFSKKSKKSTDDRRVEDSKEDKVSHQHRGRSKKRSGRKRSKESDESDSDEEDDKRKKRRRQRGFDDDVDEDKHGHRHRHRHRSRRDKKRRKSHKKGDESDEYDDDSEDESERQHRHHHKRRHYKRNDSEKHSDDSDRTNSRKKSHKHHRKQRTMTTTSDSGSENDGSENVRGKKVRK